MEDEADLMKILLEKPKPTKRIVLENHIEKIRIFSEYDFPLRMTKLSRIGSSMEYQSATITLFVTTGLNCFCLCYYRDKAFWDYLSPEFNHPLVALEVADESEFLGRGYRLPNTPGYIERELNTGKYVKKEFYDKTFLLEEPTGRWGTKVFSCTLYCPPKTGPESLYWTLTKKFVHNSVPQEEFGRWMWGNCALSPVYKKYSESKLQAFLLDTSTSGLSKFSHGDICYKLVGELGHYVPMDGLAEVRTWVHKRRYILTYYRWPKYQNLLDTIREEMIDQPEDEEEQLFQDLWGTYHFIADSESLFNDV